MPVERRGQAIRVMINLVNWQQEEPTGCGGGGELSRDGKSRVTGDCHARFCERLGVKFPGATRRWLATAIPTATVFALLELLAMDMFKPIHFPFKALAGRTTHARSYRQMAIASW